MQVSGKVPCGADMRKECVLNDKQEDDRELEASKLKKIEISNGDEKW